MSNTLREDVGPALSQIVNKTVDIPKTLVKGSIREIKGIGQNIKDAAMAVLKTAYAPVDLTVQVAKKTVALGLDIAATTAKTPIYIARGTGQAAMAVLRPLAVNPTEKVYNWLKSPSKIEPAINKLRDKTTEKIGNVLDFPAKVTGLSPTTGAANDDAEPVKAAA